MIGQVDHRVLVGARLVVDGEAVVVPQRVGDGDRERAGIALLPIGAGEAQGGADAAA